MENTIIVPGRRVGNTTRQIDNIIQALFSGKTVAIRDHYDISNLSEDKRASRQLLDKVLKRMESEHSTIAYEINKYDLAIRLK